MNINATLLAQVIHFGIVYYALRTLVLKPAYTLIKQERDIDRVLQEEVNKAEYGMQELHEKRYQLWYSGHRFFVHAASSLHMLQPSSNHVSAHRIQVPDISLDDSKQFVDDLEHAIVNRLKECR